MRNVNFLLLLLFLLHKKLLVMRRGRREISKNFIQKFSSLARVPTFQNYGFGVWDFLGALREAQLFSSSLFLALSLSFSLLSLLSIFFPFFLHWVFSLFLPFFPLPRATNWDGCQGNQAAWFRLLKRLKWTLAQAFTPCSKFVGLLVRKIRLYVSYISLILLRSIIW